MFEKEEIIHLEEDVFRLLRDLIRDYCGIYFDDDMRYLLEKRLSRRVMLRHFNKFRDYFRYLLYDKNRDDELASIVDILTVNETYFFREQNQLRTFSEEVLPDLRATNKEKKRLRIWSAGCSTGEEPYTIAMLILELGLFRDWNI
ncbi:MAG TPA: CheR family methyltransferase, partial [Thermodesulfovibrionales bacterium]|nr:CheR family methyltransferase [Thermodesulfovibrionales bacterium]